MGPPLQEAAVGRVVLWETQKATPNETPVIKKKIMVTQKILMMVRLLVIKTILHEILLIDLYLDGYSPYPRRMEFSFPKSSPNFPERLSPSLPLSSPSSSAVALALPGTRGVALALWPRPSDLVAGLV